MNKHMVVSTLLLASIVSVFSGCAKSVTCRAPDNSEIRVSVLEDSLDPTIITYRWNPFIGGWFTGDVTSGKSLLNDTNVITANMTAPAPFTIFGAKRITLNGDNDTVYLGEDSYTCNNDLSVLTTLIQKINRASTDDSLRGLKALKDSRKY
ncbi:hypothetical protein [Sulfuricurvum sp.]|uniref:hypothetical protein n=1 Tax=Sulfuricurvum sp. TaxID=2025608 RepID=UPI003563A841